MAQQNSRPNRDRDPENGGTPEPNFNWRGLILFVLAIALMGGAFYANGNPNGKEKPIPYTKFLAELKAESSEINKSSISVIVAPGRVLDHIQVERNGKLVRVPINMEFNRTVEEDLRKLGIEYQLVEDTSNLVVSWLVGLLPILLLILLIYFFFRQQIRMAGKARSALARARHGCWPAIRTR